MSEYTDCSLVSQHYETRPGRRSCWDPLSFFPLLGYSYNAVTMEMETSDKDEFCCGIFLYTG